jgi:uncharacterized protein (DUF427 family)
VGGFDHRRNVTETPGPGRAGIAGRMRLLGTRESRYLQEETEMQAIWNGVVLAESDDTVVVEGNHYFPRESLRQEYFRDSSTHSTCPWKGEASYLSVVVDGQENPDAAWYYPQPKPAAEEITDRVAFWRGVKTQS